MRDSFTEERLGPPQQPMRLFDIIRAVAYLALGGWMIYTASRPMVGALLPLSTKARLILGGILVLYGIVRLVRAFPSKSRKSRPDDFS
jgi:hypothetical protein